MILWFGVIQNVKLKRMSRHLLPMENKVMLEKLKVNKNFNKTNKKKHNKIKKITIYRKSQFSIHISRMEILKIEYHSKNITTLKKFKTKF